MWLAGWCLRLPALLLCAGLEVLVRYLPGLLADCCCSQPTATISPLLAHPQLLDASRTELAQVEQLLGGDAAALRQENEQLQHRLAQARSLLAENSPAPQGGEGGSAAAKAEQWGSGRSPLPFALFGRCGSEGGEAGADFSPATTISLAGAGACASPDVFSSPFLASQATLTVDYRALQQQATPSSARQVGGCVQGLRAWAGLMGAWATFSCMARAHSRPDGCPACSGPAGLARDPWQRRLFARRRGQQPRPCTIPSRAGQLRRPGRRVS